MPAMPATLVEAAAELVRRSCAAQGLPEKVRDPALLARAALLLGRVPAAEPARTRALRSAKRRAS